MSDSSLRKTSTNKLACYRFAALPVVNLLSSNGIRSPHGCIRWVPVLLATLVLLLTPWAAAQAQTVTLVLTPASVSENGEVSTVTATVTPASSTAFTVAVAATAGTGAVSGDFTLSGTTTLTIAANATTSTGTVTITGVDNTVATADKSVTVSGTVTGGTNVTAPGNQTLTLTDDEPTVTLVLTPASVSENGEVSTVRATLSGSTSVVTTVTVSASPGTGAVSGDFTLSGTTTLTIAANATTSTGTVTITGVDNTVATADKSVTVSGTVNTAAHAPANVTLTLTDDEPTVTLVLTPTSISENAEVSTVRATLSGSTSVVTTVTVSASPGTGAVSGDFTLSGTTTLTIAANATTSTGTVTITGVDNTVATADKSVTVSGTVNTAAHAPANVTLTLTDDEPTVTLVLTPTSISENAEVSTVRATLSGSTSVVTTVTVTAAAVSPAVSGDFTLSGATLTIAANATTSTGTVTVTGVDNNVDAPDKSVTVSGTVNTAAHAPANVTLALTDDDAVGVTASPRTLTVDEDGGTGTYTVVLASEPTADVTVTPASPATLATVSPTTLTFTSGNWDTGQTVTVTGVNDDIDSDRSTTITHTAAGDGYDAVPAADRDTVAVTLTDDDKVGVTASPTALTVTEASGTGHTATYTVVLDSEPTADVTVTPASGDTGAATVSPTTLTFTATNWSTTQTVTVTGVNDDIASDRSTTITHTAAGDGYDAVPAADRDTVAVTLTDDDKVGVTASPTALTVTEASGTGHTATYTVVLDSEPTADVTVTPASGDTGAATVSPTTLTFTATNWSTTQTVTVTGVNDDIDSDRSTTITHTAAGDGYDAVPAADRDTVAVTLTDDDKVGVTASPTALTVTEASGTGHTATYTVVLDSEPTADVTVTPASGDTGAATVSPTTLTFTATNWSTTQTVTVTGVNDDIASDRSTTITHTAAGDGYDAVPAADRDTVAVTLTDDDKVGVTASPTALTVTEASGTGHTATYTVVLDSEPTADVTVTPASGDTGAATVSPTTLTFTATNWSTTQTVTVTGVNDDIDSDRSTTITHTAAGDGYDAVPAADRDTVAVTLTDDDKVGVTASPTALTVTEASGTGHTATYTVVLDSEPTADVTVTPASGDTGAATVSPTTLTFTATNWSTTQTVTVTGVNDDIASDRSTTITHTAAGDGYDAVPAADRDTVAVTLTDDDKVGVTASPRTLTVAEDGGTGTYTVVLASEPTADVTVTPASPATLATVSPTTLTFTSGNWDTGQTVTVTGVNDDIDSDRSTTITHTAAGGGYDAVPTADLHTVVVTLTDDDAVGVTASPRTLTVAEDGGTGTYTVVLASEPTADVTVTPASPATLATVSPTTLTFTSGNWDTGQTVTVTGVNDDIDSDRSTTITHTAAGGGYDAVPTADLHTVVVTLTDDDMVGITVTPTSLTVAETTSGTYTVVLTSEPTADVTIAVSSNPTDVATVSPVSLTFTSGNWDTGQTVTVTGVDDNVVNVTDRTATVSHVVSGADYGTVTAADVGVTVTNENPEPTGIMLELFDEANAALTTVAEDAGATVVTVKAAFPDGSSQLPTDTIVTVQVTGHTASADDFAAVTDFTVTILQLESSGTMTFTLTPSSDVLMEGDETVTVSGTATGGFTVTGTEVTIIDDKVGARKARTAVNREVLPQVTQAMAASTVTAVTGRIDAVTSGVGQVPSYNLASQQTLAGIMQTVSQGLGNGSLTIERLLGGSSFVLPLHATNDGQQTGLRSLAIWGNGDYRNLGGGKAIEWDGEIFSGHLGVDTRLSANLLVGLAASLSKGSFDYAGLSGTDTTAGSYTTRMTSVHPYVNWSSPAGVDLWGSLGYGWGELGIDEQGALQTESRDTTMQTAAVGANGKVLSVAGLIPGGRTILRLKGEALLTKIKVEGDGGGIEPLSLEARRFRLALEGSHEHQLASGGRLVPAVEIGVRHDGGDGVEGTGLELGGGLRYVDPTIGLTIDGRGRALVTYGEQEYREWGASLLIRMDPGAAGQGLSLSLVPSYGQTASGVTRLWDQGMDGFGEASTSDASPRLEAVVGYGLPTLEGNGLLTPYSGVTLGSGGHQLRLGSTLAVGSSFNVSLEGTQAMRSEATSREATPVYGVRLQADWRF